jgi:endonuclease/exonuclease/phosphatase family metal-dependent hydrolase
VAKGKLTFEKSTNMAFYTDIRLKNTTLRFYNCHFESYNISIPALFKRIGNREEDVMEDTGRRMRRSITQRPQQVETVMRDIDACPVRSVVLGDFNDTPVSYTYQRLRRGHSDTFVKAGKGFGATYSLLQPLLRIDYILYPKDLKAVSYKVDRVSFSDHYPIIATYSE